MKTKLLLYIAGLLAVCPMGGNLMAQTATQPDVLKNDTVSHKLIHRLTRLRCTSQLCDPYQ